MELVQVRQSIIEIIFAYFFILANETPTPRWLPDTDLSTLFSLPLFLPLVVPLPSFSLSPSPWKIFPIVAFAANDRIFFITQCRNDSEPSFGRITSTIRSWTPLTAYWNTSRTFLWANTKACRARVAQGWDSLSKGPSPGTPIFLILFPFPLPSIFTIPKLARFFSFLRNRPILKFPAELKTSIFLIQSPATVSSVFFNTLLILIYV